MKYVYLILFAISFFQVTEASVYKLDTHITNGNISGIFKESIDLTPEEINKMPIIKKLVSTVGGQIVTKYGVQDDLLSGPTFSIDKQITLIHYFVQKGADINLQDSHQGNGAIHNVFDARIMATLLDLGANPLIRSKASGKQALYYFIYAYKDYENKDYFLSVVRRILDLGADAKECIEFARVNGDQKLVDLISLYIKD